MTIVVMAEGVDRNTALKKAQAFMPGKQFVTAKAIPSARAKAPRKNDAFYVFNATENDGYVIVSGDDRTTEILGYSKQGNLDMDNLPENLKWWLDSYARQIEALDSSWMKPAQHISKAPSTVAIKPLVTAMWDQGAPYNYMCPDWTFIDYDEPGYNTNPKYHCVTGCVATAMAQVMYYWKWPESCQALEGYTIGNHFFNELPAATFKWDLMKDEYEYIETGPAADAVAELMRYCGQAVKMTYGQNESSASYYSVIECMATNFQYSPNYVLLRRNEYSTSIWESIIYDELKADRPVLYAADKEDGTGHAFIIDGYDNSYFHINWGWGGGAYYVLSVADPLEKPGEAATEQAFQYAQSAIIGLKPALEGEKMVPEMRSGIWDKTYAVYHRSASTEDFTDVNLIGNIMAIYQLEPTQVLPAEIGWGLYQGKTLAKVLYSRHIDIPAEKIQYLTLDAKCSLSADLQEGTYQLFQVYRIDGETAWKRCTEPIYPTSCMVDVTSTTLTIRERSKVCSYVVNSMIVPEEVKTGHQLQVQANITNTGETYQQIMELWIQKQGETEWVKKYVTNTYIDPGTTADVAFSFVPKEEDGLYTLKIVAEGTDEALKTATIQIIYQEKIVIIQDGVTYECNFYDQTAKVIANKNIEEKVEHITILSHIDADGVDCKVTKIDSRAFLNRNELVSLIIQEGVEYIGSSAFSCCYMTNVELPSTITYIGKSAFNLNSLTSVLSKIQDPPAIDDNTFSYSTWHEDTKEYTYKPCKATLYVPIGTKAKYEALSGWTWFADIVESEEASTGIKSIDNGQLTIDNGAVYDLQGRKMKNPLLTSPSGGTGNGLKPGLYIVNGKKVVVK